ncbi:hypothetical protein CDAR_410031 [Caerostris darwini]|uniref:Uncharacterized protein n=1 Tax=Caerostris darwini TaxID=1538125 RepID=A0AAV4VW07_9ARAC|nr:hypothetical protein CDAR_410031 [Caerostris darwini]
MSDWKLDTNRIPDEEVDAILASMHTNARICQIPLFNFNFPDDIRQRYVKFSMLRSKYLQLFANKKSDVIYQLESLSHISHCAVALEDCFHCLKGSWQDHLHYMLLRRRNSNLKVLAHLAFEYLTTMSSDHVPVLEMKYAFYSKLNRRLNEDLYFFLTCFFPVAFEKWTE